MTATATDTRTFVDESTPYDGYLAAWRGLFGGRPTGSRAWKVIGRLEREEYDRLAEEQRAALAAYYALFDEEIGNFTDMATTMEIINRLTELDTVLLSGAAIPV